MNFLDKLKTRSSPQKQKNVILKNVNIEDKTSKVDEELLNKLQSKMRGDDIDISDDSDSIEPIISKKKENKQSIKDNKKKKENNKQDKKDKKEEGEIEEGEIEEGEIEEGEIEEGEIEEGEIEEEMGEVFKQSRKKEKKGIDIIPQNEWTKLNSKYNNVRILSTAENRTNLTVSEYYMNNREMFINFINKIFNKYRKDFINVNKKKISCEDMEKTQGKFSLLPHQNIVRDYINLYTPYRGLLLYHGLGSGKTCSSIAITEGLKDTKKVYILTPASLERNYIEELKGCGDEIYKKNHYWEWVDIKKNKSKDSTVSTLSTILHLPVDYINKKKGAWVIDYTKENNYNSLTQEQAASLNTQIEMMIEQKYQFIRYNGITDKNLKKLTTDYTVNIFDNAVIVIDEAHNFISRIINKLEKEKDIIVDQTIGKKAKPYNARFLNLYEMLLSATNARIVLLSGTPIINYPNEIAILFNILHGYTKVWNFPINQSTSNNVTDKNIHSILSKDKYIDYLMFEHDKSITITRIPYGFENVYNTEYKGMSLEKTSADVFLSDDEFKKHIIDKLKQNNIIINQSQIKIDLLKQLPDKTNVFINKFVDPMTKGLKNTEILKRRILGLSSYFRSAQEELLPTYNKTLDYIVEHTPMSDLQYTLYSSIRAEERKKERSSKKRIQSNTDEIWKETSSTYRIFSRLYCNYVIPEDPGRPFPGIIENVYDELDKIDEESIEEKKQKDNLENELKDGRIEEDELLKSAGDKTYLTQITNVLNFLKDNGDKYLSEEGLKIHSPKFLSILKNIKNPDNKGLHLLYSQFRTLEGIEIFKLVLEKNGYAQFKVKKGKDGIWKLNMTKENMKKPKFALYTGTEKPEEKELVRNIYNGQWKEYESIADELKQHLIENNNLGEIIKLFVITASGSEGINLRNTRFVHLMEPYWHPVRFEQVIGRARRICSHAALPKELQTIKVFVYLATFTSNQINEMHTLDKSKNKYSINPDTHYKTIDDDNGANIPLTSDEFLFELSNIKDQINSEILKIVKETSIDCSIYKQNVTNNGSIEHLQCVSFGDTIPKTFSYLPDYTKDSINNNQNKKINKLTGQKISINKVDYIYVKVNDTYGDLYDYDSYVTATQSINVKPIVIGQLNIDQTTGKKKAVFFK